MKRLLHFLFLLLPWGTGAQTVLEAYVATALATNEGLQQQQFQLENALLSLREARTRFAPNVSLQGNYFLAAGGRTVDFPAGDLLNPIYSTLNQLTESSLFPQLQNERILLNPNNFYDLRLHTTIPILNAELNHLQRIRKAGIPLQEASLALYRLALVEEIGLAYLRWLQATTGVAIYNQALGLANEAERVQQTLFANQMANAASVNRAQNESLRYAAEFQAAQLQAEQAAMYFNFLLNRPLQSPILVDSAFLQPPALHAPAPQASLELQQLAAVSNIQAHKTQLAGAYRLPRLNAFVDVGSQAFDWQYDNQSRYYFAGLALQWDLFSAGQNRTKLQAARVEQKQVQSRIQEVSQQMQIRRQNSVLQLQASGEHYKAGSALVAANERAYRDAQKLYGAGQLLFIELLDAQNQWVQAQLQQNIRLFDCWMAYIQAERAAYSLETN